VGRLLRADILARILAKRPLDRAAKSFSAQDIQAKSPGARVPVQIDGEVWGHLPMSLRIEPAAIKLIR
jgi:diacylglycerol kinase family enzyme